MKDQNAAAKTKEIRLVRRSPEYWHVTVRPSLFGGLPGVQTDHSGLRSGGGSAMKGDESGDHDFASGGLHRIMLARKSMKTVCIPNANGHAFEIVRISRVNS